MNRNLRTPWLLLPALALMLIGSGCGGGNNESTAQVDNDAEGAPTTTTTTSATLGEAAVARTSSVQTGCRPGQLAPDFLLTTLDGQELKMSELRGDVVIVDFWATWCKPCRMAIPHLQELNDEYGNKGLTIVAIAMDKRGERVVRPFVEKQDIRFNVVLPDGKVDRDYCGIFSLPTTFVIGPDGTVHKKYIGYRDKAVFLNDIKTLKPEITS